MRDFEQPTLSWVNWIRGQIGGDYLPELPKGIPGSSKHCVIARAITMGVEGVAGVNVSGGVELVCEPGRYSCARPRYVREEATKEVKAFIKAFDHGELPHLIDPRSREHRVENLMLTPPPGLAALKPVTMYYAPDWAKMLSPAPVKTREKVEA